MNSFKKTSIWILSVTLIFSGIVGLFNGQILPAICVLLMGLILFPPLINFLNEKFLYQIKWWMQLSLIFVLFIVFSLTAETSRPLNNTFNNSPSQQNTEQKDTEKGLPQANNQQAKTQQTEQQNETNKQNSIEINGNLSVHFIDVGQADSILIKTANNAMLIDAGNNADGNQVVSYIRSQGISKLDYVIGTHPHEDHIGGMDNIINAFDIGKIIIPKAPSTTKTFADVLNAISSKGLKVTSPSPGTSYELGNAALNILAPNSTGYKDLNNNSVVVKLTYGNTSFMLTGDAEDVSESEILSKGYNLKADVLKIAHHGSTSSTTPNFLSAIKPKYAVISVGSGNSYGHPANSTISKLNNAGIQIFRTDELGTIIATSDGNTIKFDKKASPIKQQAPPKINEKSTVSGTSTSGIVAGSYPNIKPVTEQYIGNKNSKKFHLPSCGTLPADYNRVFFDTREAAVTAGYVPCKKCNP